MIVRPLLSILTTAGTVLTRYDAVFARNADSPLKMHVT